MPHSKDLPHGNEAHARQRNLARQSICRTAKAFAVQFGHAHGNVFVAVGGVAVQTLPCVDARQSLCWAKLGLCRAICRTATNSFPVVK
jgi:tartrate dehydratase beta subunit/fumarate hydratase class I family protein